MGLSWTNWAIIPQYLGAISTILCHYHVPKEPKKTGFQPHIYPFRMFFFLASSSFWTFWAFPRTFTIQGPFCKILTTVILFLAVFFLAKHGLKWTKHCPVLKKLYSKNTYNLFFTVFFRLFICPLSDSECPCVCACAMHASVLGIFCRIAQLFLSDPAALFPEPLTCHRMPLPYLYRATRLGSALHTEFRCPPPLPILTIWASGPAK